MGTLLKLKDKSSTSKKGKTLAKSVKSDVANKSSFRNFQIITKEELEKERISVYNYLI